MIALIQTIVLALDIYWWLLIASAIFSWLYAFNVVNPRNQFVGTIGSLPVPHHRAGAEADPPAAARSRRHRHFADHPVADHLLPAPVPAHLGRPAGRVSLGGERLLPASPQRHRPVRPADAARIEGRDRERRDHRRRARASCGARPCRPRQGQGQCGAGEARRRMAWRAADQGYASAPASRSA